MMKTLSYKPVNVSVKRRHSIGDVISAHAAIAKYKQLNPDHNLSYIVNSGACMDIVKNSPYINELVDAQKCMLKPTFNLDDEFEQSDRFHNTHIIKYFCEQLGITNFNNLREEIFLTDEEIAAGYKILSEYPKPWIVLGLHSKYAPERTYPDRLWEKFQDYMNGFGGTMFSCGGPEEEAIGDTIDLVNFSDIRSYCSIVRNSDVVVCVDSSHLHVAQGCKRPIVAIEMATDLSLRLLPQTDYSVVSLGLDCQHCFGKCKYDQQNPLCGNIDPWTLYYSVQNKLSSISSKKISALIPVYSPDQENIDRCIDSIKGQVDEVVVGFDGCSPASVKLPSGCIVYHNDGDSIGYGRMMNELARISSGRYLFFLNDDVFMDDGAVQRMRSSMHHDTAIVGCRLRYPDGRIQHGGMQWVEGVDAYAHIDRGKYNPSIRENTSMEAVTFACALMRRDVFYQVGCFDEDYKYYWEDVDLCKKVYTGDWDIVYCPDATGIHVESVSTSQISNRDRIWEQGKQTFLDKWGIK